MRRNVSTHHRIDMSIQIVEQGIAAIQAGNLDEGARLLKIALKDIQLIGTMRAVACLWLAEIMADPSLKRAYYNDALAADPNNAQVRQRVEAFLAEQYMPPATPGRTTSTMPVVNPTSTGSFAPVNPVSTPSNPFAPVQPTVPSKTGPLRPITQTVPAAPSLPLAGVIGGPNGPGTAFFVAREGLLATTRYVVGGVERLTIELPTGRQQQGFVVRSYPEFDLAFIYVEQNVSDLIPVSPNPRVPDDMPMIAVSYNGQIARGKRRASNRVIASHWFPTTITQLPDAGGGPVLDDRQYVIGMITRNTSSTSAHVYGLHISIIYKAVEDFRHESMQGGGLYCSHCGAFSRAAGVGGYYCESCGALTAQAERLVRLPHPQMQGFYTEHSRYACPHCNATVGFHKNACLRCGRTVG